MVHGIVAAVWCIACIMLSLQWPACFLPVFFYFGREHAQAEYRYIEVHGRKRENCPWWCGFTPEAWNAKACLDCFLPALSALVALFLAYALKWL